MRKLLVILILVCMPSFAHADIVILKDGTIIEGKVTDVRGIFIRVESDYKTPFREFLIENVSNIELSSPDEASQRAVQNVHQRAVEMARSEQLIREVNKIAKGLIKEAVRTTDSSSLVEGSQSVKAIIREKASALIGEAVKNAEVKSLENTPEEIKVAAQIKANVLIEEAVRSVEAPRLDQTSQEVKAIAKQKAGGIIQEAVKDVELRPLQDAPQGVQEAAKKAASVLIEEAVIDAQTQKTGRAITQGEDTFEGRDIAVRTIDDALANRDYQTRTSSGEVDESMKMAAKKVATVLIEEAVINAKAQRQNRLTDEQMTDRASPIFERFSNTQAQSNGFLLTRRGQVTVGLLGMVILTLVWIRAKNHKDALEAKKEEALTTSLKEIDRELEQLETSIKTSDGPREEEVLAEAKWDSSSQAVEKEWIEKRKSPRVRWDFPILLSLDKVLPISAVVKNISMGGAYAVCNDKKLLRPGDQCRFKLAHDSNDENVKITSWAEVVRVQSGSGLGLKFLDLDASSTGYLKQVLAGNT